MAARSENLASMWVPTIAMALLIAYAAGQPLATLLVLLNVGMPTLIAVPLQILIAGFSAWRLSRQPNIYQRWAWGGVISGVLFLLTIPGIPLLAHVGSADGSAAGTDAAATALFLTLLIFGVPMLVIGGGLVAFGLVMFGKARANEPAR